MVRALWFAAPSEESQSSGESGESLSVDAGVIMACAAAALLVVALGVLMRVPGLP